MKLFFFFVLFLGLLPLTASAQENQYPENCQDMARYDPWEGWNRQVFAFNLVFDDYFLKPVAQAYDYVRPDVLQKPLNNFYDNLHEPLNALHNLLQGELTRAGDSWTRFFVNSTFGMLGFFDVAGNENVLEAREDLGQTLAIWGVGDGAYFVIPFLGPSTLRDGAGQLGDGLLLSPWVYVADNNDAMEIYYGRLIGELLETRATNLERFDNLRKSAADDDSFYALLRSLYCQKRHSEIMNGRIDNTASFEEDFFQ